MNRRSVKNFSQYQAEEQNRMYEWYGHGRPQLIEPAAGPETVIPTRRYPQLDRWNDDIGIKRYVPRLGSAERPFIIRVEPEGAPLAQTSRLPIR